jgi:hypothetical protein
MDHSDDDSDDERSRTSKWNFNPKQNK